VDVDGATPARGWVGYFPRRGPGYDARLPDEGQVRPHMPPRITLPLCLLLLAPLLARAAPPEVEARLRLLQAVTVSGYQDAREHGLKLSFEHLPPAPALALFSREEARAVIAALESEFQSARLSAKRSNLEPLLSGMMVTGTLRTPSMGAQPSELEQQVRKQYEALYGPPSTPLPTSLEGARWLQALALSPRHMPEGVREAAMELFGSPTVLLSVGMSLMLYAMAWAAPETASKHLYSLEWA
jgi:hypothetical protein